MKKAVYTYWDNEALRTYSGYRNSKELARGMALSVALAKEQFDTVQLVTNDFGKRLLIDYYEVPVDDVSVALNDINFNKEIWAFPKLYTYSIQAEPFVHLDNDVFLLEPIPVDDMQGDFLFQNRETFDAHGGYNDMTETMVAQGARVPKFITDSNVEYAFNCGVMGCSNLSVAKYWFNLAHQFVTDTENSSFFEFLRTTNRNYINHCIEQLFISKIIYSDSLTANVLIKDFDYKTCDLPSFKMAHLWGPTKREERYMTRINERLHTQSDKYCRVLKKEEPHEEVFSKIYSENRWTFGSGAGSTAEETKEFRDWLHNFIKRKKITSIVDLGCGDWQYMQLMKLEGINYTGVDVVKWLVEANVGKFGKANIDFVYSDLKEFVIPECDLLLIKDVFIHWGDREILDFLSKQIPAKYIVIVNDKAQQNSDISTTGGFRQLNIWQEPYLLKGNLELEYRNKTVFVSGGV